MPLNLAGTIFSRIWKFVDHRSAGDDVTRSDLDAALDDIADGLNGVIDRLDGRVDTAETHILYLGDFDSGDLPTATATGADLQRGNLILSEGRFWAWDATDLVWAGVGGDHDTTSLGNALRTAEDAETARTSLGLGTAAVLDWDPADITTNMVLAEGTTLTFADGPVLSSTGISDLPLPEAGDEAVRFDQLWQKLEVIRPTSDENIITFTADISSYRDVRVVMVGQVTRVSGSDTYVPILFEVGDGTNWRRLAASARNPYDVAVGAIFEAYNLHDDEETGFVFGACVSAFASEAAFVASSGSRGNGGTTSDVAVILPVRGGGYSSYDDDLTTVRLLAGSSGNFEFNGTASGTRCAFILYGRR